MRITTGAHKTTITFYGKALNARGKVEQVLVTKEPGKATTQQWTGKIYKTDREADADIIALNVAIAKRRANTPIDLS